MMLFLWIHLIKKKREEATQMGSLTLKPLTRLFFTDAESG